MKVELSFELDGTLISTYVAPQQRLIDVLRDNLNETGTKEGCREGECGACTVIVDDQAVNSCLYPALEAQGRRVATVGGLQKGRDLSFVQKAFIEMGGTQCGFCTPGMVMSATALLMREQDPSDETIRDALTGNLCRCTGYVQIVDSVRKAAEKLRGEARA